MSQKGDNSADLELLGRIKNGDRAAFSELYRQYHPRLFGYLLRFLSNHAAVEEVLDDVMLVVWKDAARFRGKSTVSTWIFGIAYHKVMTAVGRQLRDQSRIDRKANIDAMVSGASEHSDWIRSGLAQLSTEHRQVLELTYYGGFSYREIAEIAGCPVNTVKTRMFHARRRLKILLPILAGKDEDQNRESS